MAHFAQIREEAIEGCHEVLAVIVVPDSEEHRGQDFCAEDLGYGGTWIQTSYNLNIRGHFAGCGGWYLPDEDRFMPKKPGIQNEDGTHVTNWVLDDEKFEWIPPVPKPEFSEEDPYRPVWNEETQEWDLVTPQQEQE
tara:strand:+ start:54 stop:464 length:411 start_codon:yes stop_codon:yes gene_type:complete